MPIVYLVSGSNRGVGLGLVTALAARPDAIVFAGARDPDAAADLKTLQAKYPSVVHIVKLVSADVDNNRAAIDTIKEIAGRLDVVVANAGIAQSYTSILETPPDVAREHVEINFIGTLILFQAAFPLIRDSPRSASDPPPKFIPITSSGGSIGRGGPGRCAYGGSKAALNLLAKRMHVEHEKDGLVAFPLCPGLVATEMGSFASANLPDLKDVPPQTIEENASSLLKIIDNATRENSGGKFLFLNGQERPW